MHSTLTPTTLSQLKSQLKSQLSRIETDQLIIICDKNIELLYAPLIQDLKHMGESLEVLYWSRAAGERNKTLEHYAQCTTQLLAHGIHRKAHLVAIGGGALSDFAGFVAATLLRGISWSIVPTTLLAQLDAAIGGKTALNSPHGKNLLGCIHFPQQIFLCREFLLTLEAQEHQSGLGELVKYALLSEEIFQAVMTGETLPSLIAQAAAYKQTIVTRDPYEQNERKYLNLGHTFGHAYEFLTKEPHGHSVLWGIEYIDQHFLHGMLREKYRGLLDQLQLTPQFKTIDCRHLAEYFARDKKKTARNQIQLVLLKDIGLPYLKDCSLPQLDLQ